LQRHGKHPQETKNRLEAHDCLGPGRGTYYLPTLPRLPTQHYL
jgi:hypothetical protein